MTALLVTGTAPGVGTTVVIAALAALAVGRGARCTVVKPAQTGRAPAEPGDLDDVVRLAGTQVRTVELARFPDPLPPAGAARAADLPALDPAAVAQAVLSGEQDADLLLVDGAGGLLLRLDEDGYTIAELARTLRLPVLVVAGTDDLNAVAMTLEVVAHRGLQLAGLVVGAWPSSPGPVERNALEDLEMLAARPLLGALPAGLGGRDPLDVLATARAGLGPALGGTFDAAAFRRAVRSTS